MTLNQKEYLALKWGGIKGYNIKTPASKAALDNFKSLNDGCVGGMFNRQNSAQKEALCKLIDVLDASEIFLSWDAEYVSKERAKEYIMNYGKE